MIRSAALRFQTHKWWQRQAMQAIRDGLLRHGVVITDQRPDCVITWKLDPPPEYHGIPHLILEAGYINGAGSDYIQNRLRFISASWNKRNWLSDWCWPDEVSSDRWDSLSIELQPWRSDGIYVLLLEQHPGDSAAPNVGAFREGVKDYCAKRDWPLIWRHHPAYKSNKYTLEEHLADARIAITWASNSAVEAIIAGVPTYALGPGCIAAPVTTQNLDEEPYTGDRLPWLHKLAYRQWTLAELTDGTAWPHIERGLTGEY